MSLDKTTTPLKQEKQENQALENVVAGLGLSSSIIAILAGTPSRTFDAGLQIAREARPISKYRLLSAILDKAETALEALAVWREAQAEPQLQESALTRAEKLFKEKPPQTVLEALAVGREAPDKSLRDRALELAKRLFEESPPQIFTEARETYEEALSCLGFLESETVKAMLQRMIDLAEGADRKSTYALIQERGQGIQLDRDILNALLAMEGRSLQEETRQSVAGAVKDEQAV